MITVKKYSNRRLYDTDESRYITLEELAEKIQRGADVKVLDAKTGEDLTRATFAQIIVDGRGVANLLPVELLTRLIRMKDDSLAEFFSQYMTLSLDMYLAAKRGARAVQPYFPLASMPFDAAGAFARMMSGQLPWGGGQPLHPSQVAPFASQVVPNQPSQVVPEPSQAEPEHASEPVDDLASLRREIDELKQAMRERKAE